MGYDFKDHRKQKESRYQQAIRSVRRESITFQSKNHRDAVLQLHDDISCISSYSYWIMFIASSIRMITIGILNAPPFSMLSPSSSSPLLIIVPIHLHCNQ